MQKPHVDTAQQRIAESISDGQYRCLNCNRMIFKGKILKGHIEIKCPRCGELTKITVI